MVDQRNFKTPCKRYYIHFKPTVRYFLGKNVLSLFGALAPLSNQEVEVELGEAGQEVIDGVLGSTRVLPHSLAKQAKGMVSDWAARDSDFFILYISLCALRDPPETQLDFWFFSHMKY